jgi:crossover junction endodeoxyribonuclease RuvC
LKILGIDPGIASTGFGVVEMHAGTMRALGGGVIGTEAAEPLESRLATIAEAIDSLLDSHRPEAVAVEQIYFGRNVKTAFAVGQARGVVLAAAGRRGIGCHAYTPQKIKLAVCGSGAADKQQVQRMVGALLALGGAPESDHVADALAVAICHTQAAAAKAVHTAA